MSEVGVRRSRLVPSAALQALAGHELRPGCRNAVYALAMAKAKPPIVHLDDQSLNIFTDGSSYNHPRRGGIGILYVDTDENGHERLVEYCPDGYRSATNNEMELVACIEALTEAMGRRFHVDLSAKSKIVIYTDSLYVVNGFQSAKFQWSRDRWRTRDGNPVLHAVQWKELLKRVEKTGKRVEIVWHKGHSSSNPHNKTADKLAKASAGNATRAPLGHVKVRRKITDQEEVRGSVELTGQLITIRVITDRLLRPQKLYVYKYEVMSPHSPYHGCVDRIFSEHLLSAGHTYVVRVNDNTKTPRITKVRRRLEPLAEPTLTRPQLGDAVGGRNGKLE